MERKEHRLRAFEEAFAQGRIPDDYRDLCRAWFLRGAEAEEKHWIEKAVQAYAAGGKDSLDPGLGA